MVSRPLMFLHIRNFANNLEDILLHFFVVGLCEIQIIDFVHCIVHRVDVSLHLFPARTHLETVREIVKRIALVGLYIADNLFRFLCKLSFALSKLFNRTV